MNALLVALLVLAAPDSAYVDTLEMEGRYVAAHQCECINRGGHKKSDEELISELHAYWKNLKEGKK